MIDIILWLVILALALVVGWQARKLDEMENDYRRVLYRNGDYLRELYAAQQSRRRLVRLIKARGRRNEMA